MKKSILLGLLGLFLAFNLSAKTDSIPKIVEKTTEVERIVDKYTNKVWDSFATLVEKASESAKVGFKWVVKLQIAKGIAGLIPLILAIMLWISFKRTYEKASVKENFQFHLETEPIMIMKLVTATCISIVAATLFYDSVLYLIAPEWFALKDIRDLVR